MCRNYNEWMMEEIKELTPTGKLKKPSYETVANWVKDSWNAVDVNLIRRSFKCCGISNNRDGSEDDWIFNYDRLGQTDRLNDGVEIPSDKEDEEVQESEKNEDEEYENSERDEESSNNDDDSERDEESSNNDDDSERDEESSNNNDDSERDEESSNNDDDSERDEESSEYHEKENEDECEEEENKRNENEGESDDNEFCGYYKQETNYI